MPSVRVWRLVVVEKTGEPSASTMETCSTIERSSSRSIAPGDSPSSIRASRSRSSAARAVLSPSASHARTQALRTSSRDGDPAAALLPLREYEAASTVFPGNLANLFIVSRVELEEAETPLNVTVERAPGGKCGRCWTFSEKVGRLEDPEVCERCTEVLVRS